MIAENMVVSLHYTLKKGTKQGDVVENTFGQEPLVFIFGSGTMIPKFESELIGKKVGDKSEFQIVAEDAYGQLDEEAMVSLPIDLFKVEGELDMEMLVVGNVLPMQDGNGNRMDGTIKGVSETEVQMDFNHPLAGEDLFFEIEVTDVRKATDEELDHGHVHGAGGHQH